jgi:hypothetical protein
VLIYMNRTTLLCSRSSVEPDLAAIERAEAAWLDSAVAEWRSAGAAGDNSAGGGKLRIIREYE